MTVHVSDNKDAVGIADNVIDDTIVVTINLTNVNEAPVITSPPSTRSVAESSIDVYAFAATDVDAMTTLAWSVESADDGGKFEISSSGALSFKTAPNFEMPTDTADTAGNNTYVVTVKVDDNGSPMESDTHTVTVTVTDVNETPEITMGPATFSVGENTLSSDVIATYSATDPDAATSIMTWDLQGSDAGDFNITSDVIGVARLTFKVSPNYEDPADAGIDNVYDVTVRVRDNAATRLQDTLAVTVTVDDVNETPVISGGATASFAEIQFDVDDSALTTADLTVGTYTYTDEDRNPDDTITWGLSGTDATHFDIGSASGVLSFNMRPDFENPFGADNDYEVVVEADDGQGEPNSVGTLTVTVTVTNVNETPEVTSNNATQSFGEIEYDAATADLEVDVFTARDEEDGTTGITWSLSGTDAGDFLITTDAATGVGTLSFRNRPNYEMPTDNTAPNHDNVYDIIVRARDTAANTRDYPVSVSVTNVNETPEITNPPADVTNYPETPYDSDATPMVVATFTARDEETETVNLTWTLGGDDAGEFVITKDAAGKGVVTFTTVSPPDFERPEDMDGDGTYEFRVRSSDGTNTGTHEFQVTVTDVNETPELTGTIMETVTLDEHDTNDEYVVMDLVSYTARDEEGPVTWSLTGTDSGDFAISADGVVTFAAAPTYEAPEDSGRDNIYEFTVVATDVQSGSSRRSVSAAVSVTVMDVEEAGTLTVDNLSPAVGQTLTFMLTDPDGGIDLTLDSNISWGIETMAPGGSWGAVGGVASPTSTTLRYTVDEDDTGKEVRAVVTYVDRRGPAKTAESEATAAVTPDPIINAPPRFRGGTSQSIPEGEAGRFLDERLTATDRDGDTLTFGIGGGVNSLLFEVNASTGRIRAVQALDFETIPGNGLLDVPVTLHDGRDAEGNVETNPAIDVNITLSVFVTDVEEPGVVNLSAEEPEAGMPLQATLEDGDGGVTGTTWQWARSENRLDGWIFIAGASSSSYTPVEADEDFYLRASVGYMDRRGGGKSAEAITSAPVPSENRRPAFPAAEDGQRTVPENTRANVNIGAPVAAVDPETNRLTYTLVGADPSVFTIVERTGQIRTSEVLDFETKSSYSFTVEVHDGLDGMGNPATTVDDKQTVTITVENVEELGTVTLTTETGTIQARVAVTAALEDDDRPRSIGWQWSRSPNGTTGWVNIQGATFATYTPTLEEDRGSYIRATASYTDGYGPNNTAEKVSTRVGEPPPVNAAPVFPSTENGQREVEENSTDSTTVGSPVAATDLNAGDDAVNDPLAYSLSGTDSASFTIDGSTGQLRLASGVMLDFEGKRTYRVTVEVTDGTDKNGDPDGVIDDRQSVTVTVTNVNEAPEVTGDTAPSFEENGSNAVASYTAADPERDTITWSVDDYYDFWISQRGQLYFRTPPSFERGTSYPVTVTATDDDTTDQKYTEYDVVVTVTDVEEEGVVTITPPRGWVDAQTQFSADLTDDDGITGTTWQWARSRNGRSGWTDITGETSSSYMAGDDDLNQYLRATASYEDRRGSDKMAEAALSTRVADVRPAANTAPEFTETEPVIRTVREGTAAGRNVGSPVRATDADQGDVLTYSLLSGTDADDFDIDPATGQLRTKAVLNYDPEGQNEYTVVVAVHDGFDAFYNPSTGEVPKAVTIAVSAGPGPPPPGGGGGGGGGGAPPPTGPSFTDGASTSRSAVVSASPGTDVGDPVAASHPDDLGIIYSLSGADSALFTVDENTGQIRLGQDVSLVSGQTYRVTVRATDSTGAEAYIDVVIEVEFHQYDLNRNGTFEKEEVIEAINDYLFGEGDEQITKAEVIEIINLYLFG